MAINFCKALDPSVALVVGPVVTVINQGDFLIAGQLDMPKAVLSFDCLHGLYGFFYARLPTSRYNP